MDYYKSKGSDGYVRPAAFCTSMSSARWFTISIEDKGLETRSICKFFYGKMNLYSDTSPIQQSWSKLLYDQSKSS